MTRKYVHAQEPDLTEEQILARSIETAAGPRRLAETTSAERRAWLEAALFAFYQQTRNSQARAAARQSLESVEDIDDAALWFFVDDFTHRRIPLPYISENR